MAQTIDVTVGVISTRASLIADRELRSLRSAGIAVRSYDSMAAMEEDGDPRNAIVVDVASAPAMFANVRALRERFPAAWICAAGAANDDIGIRCLERGADTFTTIDAPSRMIVATLRAGARRIRYDADSLRIRFGDLVYAREHGRLWCRGKEVRLTKIDASLFGCLILTRERTVSRDLLGQVAWPGSPLKRTNQRLNVHIGYLRRKLAKSREVSLETDRAMGYRLELRSDGARKRRT